MPKESTDDKQFGGAPHHADYTEFMDECVQDAIISGDADSESEAVNQCQMMWDAGERKFRVARKSTPQKGDVDRAYSVVDIKALGDDQRIIEGIATTPTTDRVGDIVEPLGGKFALPLPLLWQHNSDCPVGTVEFAEAKEHGIPFRARIVKLDEPGELKNLADKAWQAIKHKLVKGVSIGFRMNEFQFMKEGGLRIKDWEWLELSIVTVPANAEASIHLIRSLDQKSRVAKSDRRDGKPPRAAGASKTSTVKIQEKPIMAKKTIAEQISAFEATRQAKAARMQQIVEESNEKGETFDAPQKEEYDGLVTAVGEIDEHLKRLDTLQKMNLETVRPVNGNGAVDASNNRQGNGNGALPASNGKSYPVIQMRAREPVPGIGFARLVKARAAQALGMGNAYELAKSMEQWTAETPEVAEVLKTAVAFGDSTTTAWAGTLVQYQYLSQQFAEYLYPLTIIGRIPGLTRVPFKVRVPVQSGAATVNWVGEGRVKPLTSLAFTSVTLDYAKIAGIIPLTEELVRASNPSAETIVRDSLASAIVKFMDSQFVDPTKAADDISPASITNGLTAVVPTGTTGAKLLADVNTLFTTFLSNNLQLGSAVWIMTQRLAMAIGSIQNSLGQAMFPTVNAMGGTFQGIPVITSENIPSTTGSPIEGSPMILLIANEVLLADDGQVNIDVSREASLQMDTAPDSPQTASTIMVSLWQQNAIAIKAERFINWKLRRSTAVAYIQSAVYTG